MNDLDDVLNEVWDETEADAPPALFNAAVFEQIARRKARRELGVAALIAFAVWIIAMGLAPMVGQVSSYVGQLAGSEPILIAVAMVVCALGVLGFIRLRLHPTWWLPGLRT